MNRNSRIYVGGHRGLVGGAIVRELHRQEYENTITCERRELDLTDRAAVDHFFEKTRPEYVFLAAARVGGIQANSELPAEFIYQNLAIQNNCIDSAYRHGVKKLLFLGSSCIYPKHAQQPIREEALLTGSLEPTNQWYAIAKIAGLMTCQAYVQQYGWNAICLMPTNLYGPGDNFSETQSHVLPALIRRFDDAKRKQLESVVIWGTGSPRREFLHVDDLASACLFLMNAYNSSEPINVGCGEDVSIAELAAMVREVVGYKGEIVNDLSKPDGTPRKLLDVSRLLSLGWRPSVPLDEGIRSTYDWYVRNRDVVRS